MVLGALWGSGFLQRVHHLAPISAAHVVESIFVGSIFGAPIAGFLSDRWGYRRRPMLFGALLTLLVMVWLLVVNSPSYKLLLALFFAIGFFSSAQVIVYAMVAESNSKELTGTATGLASVIIMGGAGLAQVLFGQLLDWHWLGTYVDGQRMYAAEDYHFAMMMFPIAFIIGLIAAMFSKETNCRPRVVEDI
jgi:sugar phosphate permease